MAMRPGKSQAMEGENQLCLPGSWGGGNHRVARIFANSGSSALDPPFSLISTEAQQRRDIARSVEFLIVLYVEQFKTLAEGQRSQGVGHVFKLSRLSTTGRAGSHQARL